MTRKRPVAAWLIEWSIVATVLAILAAIARPDMAQAISRVPYYLLLGWWEFGADRWALLHVNSALMMQTGVGIGLLTVGSHRFCRWLYKASAADRERVWLWRWTFSGLAILLLVFTVGIASIALVHQIAWLKNDLKPFWAPDYSGHVVRSRLFTAYSEGVAITRQLEARFREEGAFPGEERIHQFSTSAFSSPVKLIEQRKEGVVVVQLKEIVMGGPSETITFTPTAGQDGRPVWHCSSSLPPKALPHCQGQTGKPAK